MNNKAIFQPSDAFAACDIHKSFLKKIYKWLGKQLRGKTIDLLVTNNPKVTKKVKCSGRVGQENVTNKSGSPTLGKR